MAYEIEAQKYNENRKQPQWAVWIFAAVSYRICDRFTFYNSLRINA